MTNEENMPRFLRSISNEEKLHRFLTIGDVDAIMALHSRGVNLEWTDRGLTPLMKACTSERLLKVASALIGLGSRVDALCPGSEGGTPLHIAARNDLERTVMLLLSNGANAHLRNEDGRTALDVARMNGSVKAIRAIENHISCFSGWLRVRRGFEMLQARAPGSYNREFWVVSIPRYTGCAHIPPEMEVAIYKCLEDAEPYKVLHLSDTRITKTKLDDPDPNFTLIDLSVSGIPISFSSSAGNDGKEQLLLFYDICNSVWGNLHASNHQEEGQNEEEEECLYEQEEIDFLAAGEASLRSSRNSGIRSSGEGSSSRCWEEVDGALEGESRLPSSVPTAPPLGDNRTCIICCNAPVEGACIPCGHMNCCMTCLKKIDTKENGCPICRGRVDQVVRIHIG